MLTDNQLLQNYLRDRSESAFSELVERRINLVYSAALRESAGDAAQAQDITQAVFTELARRGPSLLNHPALAGWLYTCVRRMAANTRRADQRRHRRETESATMNTMQTSDPLQSLWLQVRPELDNVMHELNDDDRAAVVMRFFEGRSLKEVGAALGLRENAARMRVERALEKLRDLLSRRGITSTGSTLAAVLATGAILNAPAALASTIATAAMQAAPSALIPSSENTWFQLLTSAPAKIAAALGALVLLALFIQRPASDKSVQSAALKTTTADQRFVRLSNTAAAAQDTPTIPMAAGTMTLRVVETETGKPLDNAKLHLFYLYPDGRGQVIKATSGAGGVAKIDTIRPPFRGLNMFVTAPGHVPKVTSWGFGREMPAEYTMKLETGLTIAGHVFNDAGEPISGARLEFDGPGNDSALEQNIQFGPEAAVFTDPAGRWSSDMIPREHHKVSISVTHADYADTAASILPASPEAQRSVITMTRGLTVSGVIQDLKGKPISAANVREARLHSREGKSTATTDDGAYSLTALKPGEIILAVEAEGFAPVVRTLQLTNNLSSLAFQLAPGGLLRGRVTDESGTPIAGAFVETTRGRNIIRWSATTDDQGRFEWRSAPAEPLLYSIYAHGFERNYSLTLPADGSTHEIKLSPERPENTIRIAGNVLDDTTGRPLDDFRVLRRDMDDESAFPPDFVTTGKEGAFTFTLPAQSRHPLYEVLIEKNGYQPVTSKTFSREAGNQNLEFRLTKAAGPSGTVLLSGGQPAEDCMIYLCTAHNGNGLTINGPAQVEFGANNTSSHTKSDAQGKFSLPAALAPQAIIAIHPHGFAEISLAEFNTSRTITLQPWGRVEGSVILEGQPVPNDRVVAYDQITRYDDHARRFSLRSFYLETHTDAQGRFVFEKVPPGRVKVFRQRRLNYGGFESHDTALSLTPGETAHIQLGGSGMTIIGTATLPAGVGPVDWSMVSVHLRSITGADFGPRPRRREFWSNDAYIAAFERFASAATSQKRYGAVCRADGSFRIADVPPGEYQLEIIAHAHGLNSVGAQDPRQPREVASIKRPLSVPDDSDALPLDLGTVQLEAIRQTASAQ